MDIEWDPVKNERLKRARGVSFEEILNAKFLAFEDHPSRLSQQNMIFEWKGYVWVVPFVRSGKRVFLKPIYPSRKHTKQYQSEV